MASYDVASNFSARHLALHIINTLLSPRWLSFMASYDMMSNICQALVADGVQRAVRGSSAVRARAAAAVGAVLPLQAGAH
jgi:hypothetical protein